MGEPGDDDKGSRGRNPSALASQEPKPRKNLPPRRGTSHYFPNNTFLLPPSRLTPLGIGIKTLCMVASRTDPVCTANAGGPG